MDMVIVFLALFFTSIATFSYLAYKLYRKSIDRWVQVGWGIWVMLSFSMFLSGFLSGDIVMMVFGLAIAFGNISLFFSYYIKSELGGAKRFLEVIFGAVSLGIIVYGYVITGSLILEVATLFIIVTILIAFMLSYFLPRIHAKLKSQRP
ncbi:MAG: hypothetical protein ACPL1Z_05040 [Candidatus Bathyarchaeales archaeon]